MISEEAENKDFFYIASEKCQSEAHSRVKTLLQDKVIQNKILKEFLIFSAKMLEKNSVKKYRWGFEFEILTVTIIPIEGD